MMGKPKIRFKGYNEDWEQRKLGEVFEQTTNFVNLSKDDIELWSLTVEDGLTPKSERYNREFLVKKDTNFKEVRPGDIVYNPMNMTLGAVGYNGMSKSVAISGYYTTMITKDGNDSYYINTWLKSPQAISLYKIYATGSLIEKQRVQFPTLSTIPAVFPKYEEQHKIGCYFEAIDHLITLHQHKCDEMKKLKKCMLQKMFPQNGKKVPEIRFEGFTNDWEQRKLGDVLSLLKDGTHGTHRDAESGPLLLSAKNIKNGTVQWDESDRRISEDEYNIIHSNFRLQKGDVLLTIVGSIGEVAILSQSEGVTFQRSVAFLRPSDEICSEFLYSEIQGQKFQKELNDRKSTSAQPGMYLGDLGAIPIEFPTSDEEQMQIGSYFSTIDHLITLHQHKCDELQNLKKYMLQNMFV